MSDSAGEPAGPWRPAPLVPLVLLVLALADLRVELRLLADHFTFSALAAAIRSHLLASSVLLLQPSLWRQYRRERR
ncbi:MAG: hypothetical protein VKI81_02910 [Synechococcaceae cyanobacterium]|nr:hypothetical protein [Synechococcaceae cyanobacterium]